MSGLSASPHRRQLDRAGLPVLLLLAAGILLLLAPVADAGGYTAGCDWRHLAQVAGRLSTLTPERPMVYLLGGSAARECTIRRSAAGAPHIRKAGGPDTLAYNLGATGQTYEDNLVLIEMLPRVPSIVIIGVIVGRYTRTGARDLPDVRARRHALLPAPLHAEQDPHGRREARPAHRLARPPLPRLPGPVHPQRREAGRACRPLHRARVPSGHAEPAAQPADRPAPHGRASQDGTASTASASRPPTAFPG